MLNEGWTTDERLKLPDLGAWRDGEVWRALAAGHIGETRFDPARHQASEGLGRFLRELAHDGSDLGFLVRMLHVHWREAPVYRQVGGCLGGFFDPAPAPLSPAVARLAEAMALPPPRPRLVDAAALERAAPGLAPLRAGIGALCALAAAHGAVAAAVAPLPAGLAQAEIAPELAEAAVAQAGAALRAALAAQGQAMGGVAQTLAAALGGLPAEQAAPVAVRGALLLACGDAAADALHAGLFAQVRDLPLRALYDALAALGLYGWRADLRDIAVGLHHRVMVEAAWRRMDALAERYDALREIEDPDTAIAGYEAIGREIRGEAQELPPLQDTRWWHRSQFLRDARRAFDQAVRGGAPPETVAAARGILNAQTRAWRIEVVDEVAAAAAALDAAARELAPLPAHLDRFIARIGAMVEEFGP
jgi:hypothetical protein